MPAGSRKPPHQAGFTLLAVLAAMFILSLGSQVVMVRVARQVQREHENQLLRIGEAYAGAIGRYYEQSPGTLKTWPATLDDLVDDRRFVMLRRHLRKLYDDPVSRSPQWGLILATGGGIQGVYSVSPDTPIQTAALQIGALHLPSAHHYSDWRFQYQPSAEPRPYGGP